MKLPEHQFYVKDLETGEMQSRLMSRTAAKGQRTQLTENCYYDEDQAAARRLRYVVVCVKLKEVECG